MPCFLTKNEPTRNSWVLEELSKLPPGARILDAGCGQQPYREGCKHLEYVSQDFGQYTGLGSEEHKRQHNPAFKYGEVDVRGDIWNIPLPSASFDAVLCTEVLEHVPYPNETLRELARLLKPGGKMIVTAPVCSIPHFNPYFFYNGFSREFYELNASQNGLVIEQISENGNEFLYVLQESMRLIQELPSKLQKLVFGLCAAPFFGLVFLVGKTKKARYLSFGYHVRFRKV